MTSGCGGARAGGTMASRMSMPTAIVSAVSGDSRPQIDRAQAVVGPTLSVGLEDGLRVHFVSRDRVWSKLFGCQGRMGKVRTQTFLSFWSRKSARCSGRERGRARTR